jgi:hypothetical protein
LFSQQPREKVWVCLDLVEGAVISCPATANFFNACTQCQNTSWVVLQRLHTTPTPHGLFFNTCTQRQHLMGCSSQKPHEQIVINPDLVQAAAMPSQTSRLAWIPPDHARTSWVVFLKRPYGTVVIVLRLVRGGCRGFPRQLALLHCLHATPTAHGVNVFSKKK